MSGAINIPNPDWSKIALDFAVVALPTMLMTIVLDLKLVCWG